MHARRFALPILVVLAIASGLLAGGCGSDSSSSGATTRSQAMKHDEAMKHGDGMKHESSGDAMKHGEG